jgi:hypothetical protein
MMVHHEEFRVILWIAWTSSKESIHEITNKSDAVSRAARALPLLTRGLLTPSASKPHVQFKVPRPLSAQLLLQQSELTAQGLLVGRQLAAAAAVGATIEVTNGTATAAAMPRRFINTLRDN